MLRPWKLELEIDKKLDKAVYLQIADTIIGDIRSGRLKAGDTLPGSRNLAQSLKINRNTVVEAYQVLINEEWVISRERKGIFVSENLPALHEKNADVLHHPLDQQAVSTGMVINFDDGHPDSKIAPVTELARAYRQIFSIKAKWQMMGYGNEHGDVEFRKMISQMLNHQRGMHIQENDISITRGSQMGMFLTAQSLLNPEDIVIVEDPGYQPAWQAFQYAGAQLLPVPVDHDGISIEAVEKLLKQHQNIKAIYITPHRQYPTTVTLSLARRLRLIELSNQYNITIIEDDYDNEFHFGYRPILPISSFAELHNYVYIGTLSKVVAPALRIGYLATKNQELLKRIGDLRKIIDVHGDVIMEQAVLQLIKEGAIKKHIRKATVHYKNKRDFVFELLTKYMKDIADFTLPEGGLAFWIVPKAKPDWDAITELLLEKNIKIIHPKQYSKNHVNGFRLSYGALSEEQLEQSIPVIAEIISVF
ncbi:MULTISPECIES: MocR-like pyridoxine biosynthesis transcription factor PdxR [Chryseobacterium]|uniref:GntR family transcriptional regulator/MocR family aminotransferase n=1 Tax=Chryseobacterium aquifrigidense TaxID=558021 RepID=A0A543EIY8_9FLAO|nr:MULTISPECIES: PLP-dependent aminotransferase family protein [Chryseobacterium]MDR6369971.1 GntR family transcriptional regulator/MocR family aminotransferase [Chryseobacterium vietnamense]TQM21535.1 GntR family transcriptional regulator/MocR family aminotransferase [Chryseobacterium aquifrigidense]